MKVTDQPNFTKIYLYMKRAVAIKIEVRSFVGSKDIAWSSKF